jgi:hypothetical protein
MLSFTCTTDGRASDRPATRKLPSQANGNGMEEKTLADKVRLTSMAKAAG